MRTRNTGVVAAVLAATAMAGSGSAAVRTHALVFDAPVRLTPLTGAGGFEPSLVVDHLNNVWVTAHRSYVPVSPDSKAATPVRFASWLG